MAEEIKYSELLEEACKKFNLPENTKERLAAIPWDKVAALGVNVEKSIFSNKENLERMAYDHPTHLVNANIDTPELKFNGEIQVIPEHSSKNVVIRTRGKVNEPSLKLFGKDIYSEKAKAALLEKGTITTVKGKKVNGYLNANAGFPIPSKFTDKDGKEHTFNYFVSVDPETNQIDFVDTRVAAAYIDSQKQMYGVTLTDSMKEDLKAGKAVVLHGCKFESGSKSCAIQYNATSGKLIPCNPSWLKEVIRNANNQTQAEEVKAEAAPAKKAAKKAAPKVEKTEVTTEVKKTVRKKVN